MYSFNFNDMITKIFQGPKHVVEAQLASYTSSLSSLFSICFSTETGRDNLSGVKKLTIIVRHPNLDLQ